MIRRLIILLFIVGCVFAREYIAIIDFEGIGVTEDEARALTQRLTSEMISLEVYQLVERSEMKQLLDEQKFQYSGCVDTKCAVEIGKMIGAKYMVVGSISKIDDIYTIDTRLINVESSEAYASGQYTSQESLSNVLVNGMKSIAYQLCDIEEDAPTISIINFSHSNNKRTFGFSLGGGGFNTEECQKCENSPFSMAIYFNFNRPLKNLQLEFSTITDFGIQFNTEITSSSDYSRASSESPRMPSYFGILINKHFFIQKFNYYLGGGYSIHSNPIPNRERLGLHTGINLQLLSISSMDLYFGGNMGCSIINNSNPILKFSILLTSYF